MKKLLKKAHTMGSTTEAEALLKKHGLYDVEVRALYALNAAATATEALRTAILG